MPVYLAVRGKVYDVTAGRNFYGPGGPYENFAGRDATRGLACQSFDEEMLTKDLDGPLDPCEDLTAEQRENLQGWIERFDEKVRATEHTHKHTHTHTQTQTHKCHTRGDIITSFKTSHPDNIIPLTDMNRSEKSTLSWENCCLSKRRISIEQTT